MESLGLQTLVGGIVADEKKKEKTIAEKAPGDRTQDERLQIIEEALARDLNIDLEAVAERVSNG